MSEHIPGLPEAPHPPTPKDASAVLLYRQGANGLEVFWLKRERNLRFAGGFYAFPGGRSDASDAAIPVVGASGDAARLIVTAARELFEEAGVLHARGTLPNAEIRDQLRRELLAETLPFATLLERHHLTLHADDFPEAGRWVTPPFLNVRFDARFFLVETSADASVWKGELESGEWTTPAAALERWKAGTALLHPPNLFALQVLARFTTKERALDELRTCPWVDGTFMTYRTEFQRGVHIFPLKTLTLPPAAYTNCYLLGTKELLVVDPGSVEDSESARLVKFLRELMGEGYAVKAIVLTHHHADHVSGAKYVQQQLGVPVWAHAQVKGRVPVEVDRELREGDVLELSGPLPMRWQVYETPGHARGHVTLVDEATQAGIVGDMVAGIGTIVIDPPEGDMAEYLWQLIRLKGLLKALFPSHGPVIPDGVAKLDEYLQHRAWREGKVLAALEQPGTVIELVQRAYDDVQAFVWPLAERNTVAILDKLEKEGRATQHAGRWSLVQT